jgi:hypothetical protein
LFSTPGKKREHSLCAALDVSETRDLHQIKIIYCSAKIDIGRGPREHLTLQKSNVRVPYDWSQVTLILNIFCNFGNCIFRRSRNVAFFAAVIYRIGPHSRIFHPRNPEWQCRLHTFSDIKTFCPLVETMPEQIVPENLEFWPKP